MEDKDFLTTFFLFPHFQPPNPVPPHSPQKPRRLSAATPFTHPPQSPNLRIGSGPRWGPHPNSTSSFGLFHSAFFVRSARQNFTVLYYKKPKLSTLRKSQLFPELASATPRLSQFFKGFSLFRFLPPFLSLHLPHSRPTLNAT